MATGVLVLAVERATRLLPHLNLDAKAYSATIRLGRSTTTDDAEGDATGGSSPATVTEAEVRTAMLAFTGAIQQVPSTVSAIKVRGERAYRRARSGEEVVLAARPVTVSRFDAVSFARSDDVLDVSVEVECSAGTYVRALARDLGVALGVGGHLIALRRTRVGPFGVDVARTLDELSAADDPVAVPMADAVRSAMPVRMVTAAEAVELSFGRFLASGEHPAVYGAIGPDGTVVALLRDVDGRARPVLVFATA
jgi:tRNA pseudouridine55 synthase